MIDIAIIGAGPAGLSAAINAYARNKSLIVFGNKINTSALFKAKKIDNHLGMLNKSGSEILNIFLDHATKLNINIKTGRVTQILSHQDYFIINFENNFFEARSIIIATGIYKSSKIINEEKFIGRGVSYCATCDGMLFKNKSVFATADNSDAEDDVKFLSEICQKVFYLPKYNFNNNDIKTQNNFLGSDNNFNNNIAGNIEILSGELKKIIGDETVNGVLINEKNILCDGVFLLNKNLPPEKLIFGLNLDHDFIKINNACETNLPGVFAAGDCTGWPWQLSKAIGQGQVAAQMAAKFVSK